jgi:hypothetical protein
MIEPFDETAPAGDELTDYDRSHVKLYMRLFDADAMAPIGARWSRSSLGLIRQRSPSALDRSTIAIWRGPAG